ncbi:protein of unknown function [Variovorax sp. YR750]|uniref:DUF802 domain-containing protein n=1 Tax=Variovorax sp. YR750 TaxID=1884384 RepID=UPI0008B81C35|nr:DUF802 domain-containing protein [Variovorax sp. YR750]SEL02089.1 protein of unknown function [Variovorax sp. YR750]
MTRFLHYAVFVAGLAVVGWVGAGYIGTNPLALAVTLIIGAFYIMGALELYRFQQATDSLAQATADLSAPPDSLGIWLDRLHPSLRNAVRLRIEGERVGLPGPALTPYLAGFLVLLGMLGTFIGMVVTLRGTGIALESSTDLQTIRDSLSAPVKGLGLAFGTSVAGVAASAMLGLASALSRRERLQAGQLLDTKIATVLRVFSQTHQREESFKLLQQQAHAMPEMIGQLQAMVHAIERQNQSLSDRLAASQDSFHSKAEAVYGNLASSVDQSLKQSLTESARVAGAAIQPVVEATMAGIARETAALHQTISNTVQQQLDGLSGRFEATTDRVADTWKTALAEHQHTSEALSKDVRGSHDHFAQTFEQRSAALVDSVSARLESTVGNVSKTWGDALAQHQQVSEKLSGDAHQALTSATAAFEQHTASLLQTVDQAHAKLQTELAARDEQRLSAWTQSLADMGASLHQQWQQAGAHNASQQQQLLDTMAQTARDTMAQTETHAKSTVAEIARLLQAAAEAPQAASDAMSQMAQRDEQRLAAWTQSLTTMAASLQQEWQQVNAHHAGQQQQLIDAMTQTARDTMAQTEAHAKSTVAEIARLLQAASEAPQAAADAMSQMASRDEERLATWTQSLTAMAASLQQEWKQVNAHHAGQQQQLIDTMVQTARDTMAQTETHAKNTVAEISRLLQAAAEAPQAAADAMSQMASRDEQRLAAWTQSLGAMAASLQQEWQQANSHNASQQQQLFDTMAQTARDMSAQTEAHAKSTVTEIAQLLQAASEAPRAAAEVVTELRQKLADSMARDNTMLEERSRILETLSTLLDAVNHASTEQRAAIDTLVSASAEMLERVGSRFTEKAEAESDKMSNVAAQIAGSAVEVASLGEAFGLAVQLFSQSNDKLAAHLQRIEGALGKSISRSDEQLAYYVAQAREVIDLSIMSQKQIVEDMQQIASRQEKQLQAPVDSEA